jgi:hypothetical protein
LGCECGVLVVVLGGGGSGGVGGAWGGGGGGGGGGGVAYPSPWKNSIRVRQPTSTFQRRISGLSTLPTVARKNMSSGSNLSLSDG